MLNRRTFLLGLTLGLAAARVSRAAGPFDAASTYNRRNLGASLLVMVGGQVLHEEGSTEPYALASGTKSFVGVMALLAEQDGLLKLDEPASETLPEWRDDARRAITIRQLLTLTSGLPGGNVGRPPSYRDALKTEPTAAPGKLFQYGPIPFQAFGEVMRRKLQGDPLAYLEKKVLQPAGVNYARWKRGRDGNPQLPSGASLTAREWARFGEWVRLQPNLGPLFVGTAANPAYGLTWWLNRPVEAGLKASISQLNSETDVPSEKLPGDLVMAAGLGKQRLYLVASRQLVVVRQTNRLIQGGRAAFSDVTLLGHVLAALPPQSP